MTNLRKLFAVSFVAALIACAMSSCWLWGQEEEEEEEQTSQTNPANPSAPTTPSTPGTPTTPVTPPVTPSWTAVADSKFGTSTINSITYGNNKFVAVGGMLGPQVSNMVYSADGVTWTAVANSTFGSNCIHIIAYANGKFVAGGYNGTMATSLDGINWIAIDVTSIFGTTFYDSIYGIAYGNNRFVAVGGNAWVGGSAIAYSTGY